MIIKIMYRIFLIKPIAFFGKKCYYISIKDNRVDSGEYGAVKYGSQCRSYGELNCGRIRKLLCPFRIPLLHIYPRKKVKYAGIMYCASVFIRRCFFMQKNKRRRTHHARRIAATDSLRHDDSAGNTLMSPARLSSNWGISGRD